MKNTITLVWLLAFCFGLLAFRPFAWVPVTLDSRVSVLLPSQPQEAPAPAPTKMLFVKDAAGVYLITTSPLGEDFQGADRKTYYDSVIKGVLESSKGKLEGRSTFKVGNYDGIDFSVSVAKSDKQQAMLVFIRSVLVDKKSYTLQFLTADSNKSGALQCKPFFESITLKPVAK
jgi:hypothetical protein